MPDDYDPDDYLTPAQVAALWKISPAAVRKAIHDGRLPALVRPGRRYLIHKRNVRFTATGGSADTSLE